jgi:V/A-type H+-transporting ATPase subunit C
MADFDYGNARLRAMKSRLLSRSALEALAETETIKGLILALAKTPYERSIEAALVRSSGMESIVEALRSDQVTSLGKIRGFYQGRAREMVGIVLRSYDIHNLKTILRGLSQNIKPGEILGELLPIGDLTIPMMEALSRASEPRAAIDLLASTNSPFAQPLLKLRGEHPGADTAQMELALEKWGFWHARSYLEHENLNGGILSKANKLEADLKNLLTVLRFIQSPAERKHVGEWLGEEDLTQLLLGPGFLAFDLLVQAGMQNTLEAAVNLFAGTPYAVPLREGLKNHSQSRRLSEFEQQLQHFRLKWMSEQVLADPLGIGMVLGYCALKVNEINNLRWISQGIHLGLSAIAIRENLGFAA